MGQKYSDDQLAEMADFYHEHGAVKLPGLVDPVWAQKVMAAIDHAIACYSDQRVPGVALSYGRGDGQKLAIWRPGWKTHGAARNCGCTILPINSNNPNFINAVKSNFLTIRADCWKLGSFKTLNHLLRVCKLLVD